MFHENIEFPELFVEIGEPSGFHPASLNKSFTFTNTPEELGIFFGILVFFLRIILAPPDLKSYLFCSSRKCNFFKTTYNLHTTFHLGKINIFHLFQFLDIA